jgi:uncharacterized protein YchJ
MLDGKMGYVDSTGKVVIPRKYNEARAFHDGLAAVLLHGKYGFIDKTGAEVIPPTLKYKSVGDFHDGLAWVCVSIAFLNPKEHLYIYIDKKGKKIIPDKYREVNDFYNGLASVRFRIGLRGTIDTMGKPINVSGVDFAFSNQDRLVHQSHDGLVLLEVNGKWGFIDTKGNEVIPFKYEHAHVFNEGPAAVKLNDKWGFLDKTGKEITPLKYERVQNFHDGSARVKLNGKWHFIKKDGSSIFGE